MSGIFRPVHLVGFPLESRIEDFRIRTLLDQEYVDAKLDVQVSVHGSGKVEIKLLDSDKIVILSESKSAAGNEDLQTISFSNSVKNPFKWTAETPNLYHLLISLDGKQFISQKVGFRQVELKDGLIKVNGQRVVLRGVRTVATLPLKAI